MKKALSFILAALLAVSVLFMFASCGKLTAYQLVSEALEKTAALDAMDAEMKMNMKMVMEGVTVEMPMTGHMKTSGLKGEKPVFLTDMTTTVMGQEMAVSVYGEGDYVYTTMSMLGMTMNGKTKAAELPEEYDISSDFANMTKSIPEDVLKDVEIVKNSDGTKTVATALPDEVFGDIYSDFINNVVENADLDEDVKFDISDAKVEITVDKSGYVSVYKLAFKMTMTMSVMGKDIAVSAYIDSDITYKNPGAAVTVTPPEGYQDFPEMDEDDFAA